MLNTTFLIVRGQVTPTSTTLPSNLPYDKLLSCIMRCFDLLILVFDYSLLRIKKKEGFRECN